MSGPDVVRLVEELRAEVDVRRSHGEVTPEDFEALFSARISGYVAEAKIDPSLGRQLQHESHDWNIDTAYEVRTPRTGLAGVVIHAAKQVVRPLVRLYTDHLLNRQAQINLVVWHFLLDSVRRTLLLELEVKKLQHQIDELKQKK